MKKYILFIIVIFCLSLVFPLFFNYAYANNNHVPLAKVSNASDPMGRLKKTSTNAGFISGSTDKPLPIAFTIGEIIKYILSFLGIIFLILILYSGFLWMTARGEAEQIKKAQGILKNAAIGLLIVLSAYIITYFVMNKLIATTEYKV